MGQMAKKKKEDLTQPFQLRLHPLIRKQLETLAKRNVSSLSSEVVTAIKKHLADNGLWPLPGKS